MIFRKLKTLLWLNVIAVVALASEISPQSDDYTINTVGTGANESIVLKVSCTADNPSVAADVASRYAVHGLVYTGCAASENYPEILPLVKSEELTSEQALWLNNFFKGVDYKQFIVSVAKNNMKIIKGKKNYMVEVVVAVDARKLRQELEKAGVVRKLGSVFDNN